MLKATDRCEDKVGKYEDLIHEHEVQVSGVIKRRRLTRVNPTARDHVPAVGDHVRFTYETNNRFPNFSQ